jgi:PKD repeat protein/putative hemolysin
MNTLINLSASFLLSLLICSTVYSGQGKNLNNPSRVYCESLGYEYEIKTDKGGNQFGICKFPNKTSCDAWEFYRGKAGQPFSYCVKNGYDIDTKVAGEKSYTKEFSVCIPKGDRTREVPMIDLMIQNGDFPDLVGKHPGADERVSGAVTLQTTKDAPASFDWRNYNGRTFIGPVRDQGNCGSCYSFGAAAAAEGTYNFATGSYDGNCINFSESFIIWCLGKLTPYSSHFSGCDGADYEYQELQALVDIGIPLESAFPYTQTDPGPCTHMDDPKTIFNSWGRVNCNDIAGIKAALQTYGVVDAAVLVTTDFENYTSGVFSDSNTACADCAYETTNHAISLVGWGNDAQKEDYWILRNSWGTGWGENGYMRIQVNSAAVACAVAYISYSAGTPQPPTANFSLASSTCQGNPVTITDSSLNTPTSWHWSFSPSTITYVNGTTSSSQNPQVTFNEPGAYQVTLLASNAQGSDSETKSISVGTCCIVGLSLLTDDYGSETTWTLQDSDGTTLYSGGPYGNTQTYTVDMELKPGSYTFTIYDAYGDGICCGYGSGSYSLTNLCTDDLIVQGGNFGDSEATPFAIAAAAGECPACTGNSVVLENCMFLAGRVYNCVAAASITVGSGVTMEVGSVVTLTAPSVGVQGGFNAPEGARLLINH